MDLDYIMKLAQENIDKGNYEIALQQYDQAAELYPRNPKVRCNRSYASIKLKRFEEAVDDCSLAININPKLSDVHMYRGIAFICLSRFEEAIEDFTKELALDPNDEFKKSHTYYFRSLAFAGIGKFEESTEDLKRSKDAELENNKKLIVKCLDSVRDSYYESKDCKN